MELPGHVGVALLVYAPVAAAAIRRGRRRTAWLGLAGVLVLCTSPDIDLHLAGVAHRGVTHTALAALLAAGAVALLASLLRPSGDGSTVAAARFGAIVGGSGVLSHLLGDVVTPMGIRPFLPFSGTTYTLSLVYAADARANVALLVAGVAVFAAATASASRTSRSPKSGGVPGSRGNRLSSSERS